MKIVVLGASGLIGSKVSYILAEKGHRVVAASPRVGVNTVTGKGLAAALADAEVVVDLTNSPSFEATTAMNFFTASTRNLLEEESRAGCGHHIGLSVVGAERLTDVGYFRAKSVQEEMIRSSSIPYTIVHSTQSFEFLDSIARASENEGDMIFLPLVYFQPIASDDIAVAVAEAALSQPANGSIEIAGPLSLRMPEIMQRFLASRSDPRNVSADIHAPYFGAEIDAETLMPSTNAKLGSITFEAWLSTRQAMHA